MWQGLKSALGITPSVIVPVELVYAAKAAQEVAQEAHGVFSAETGFSSGQRGAMSEATGLLFMADLLKKEAEVALVRAGICAGVRKKFYEDVRSALNLS